MSSPRTASIVHAPGVPTYELHTLGWRAFQDLCATVLREVWRQSVQSFADSRDGGRDGAFYGQWNDTTKAVDLPEGPFVLQCKFLARRDETLTLSGVQEELAEVDALVKRGLCHSYESRLGAGTIGALRALGHAVRETGPWAAGGSALVISADSARGVLAGGADPRQDGVALGG